MKPKKRHLTKEEHFKASFGYSIPRGKKQTHIQSKREGSILLGLLYLPFWMLAKIIQFTIVGPRCVWNANPAYMALSGLFMLFSSIAALLFIRDIGLFIKSLDFIGDFSVPLNGLLVIFLLIQLVRGSNFINHANAAVAPPGSSIPTHRTNGGFQTGGRSYDEIADFKGYVNSKMSWMSNSDKEKYVKELFEGKKS
jgi:hypothetical protein